MKPPRSLFLALVALSIPHSSFAAPHFIGPNKCSSCHDHEKQKAWADQDKHAKALSQLEDKNAAKYAKAIGLADPYDLKGACVSCHATVFNGDANAGVSCETCHGAGSDYAEPHQQKGSYAKALTLGMFDTRGNYPVWAKMCLNCHIVRDAKLVVAGHKSGADFEVGAASQKIVHWAPAYDFSKLSALGRGAASRAGGSGAAAAPKRAPATSRPAPTVAPAAVPKPTIAARPRVAPTTAREATGEKSPAASSPAPVVSRAPATAVPGRRERTTREPTSPRMTVSREGITIQIQATPIPSVTPTSPTAARAPEAKAAAPPPPSRSAAHPPSPRAHPRHPRSRRAPAIQKAPAPSPTPTKVPAPQEPPRRPPH